MKAKIKNGWTKMPNEFLEGLHTARLNGLEWATVMVIARSTWGYHRKNRAIGVEYVAKATRRHVRGITDAFANLIARRIVIVDTGHGLGLSRTVRLNDDPTTWIQRGLRKATRDKKSYLRKSKRDETSEFTPNGKTGEKRRVDHAGDQKPAKLSESTNWSESTPTKRSESTPILWSESTLISKENNIKETSYKERVEEISCPEISSQDQNENPEQEQDQEQSESPTAPRSGIRSQYTDKDRATDQEPEQQQDQERTDRLLTSSSLGKSEAKRSSAPSPHCAAPPSPFVESTLTYSDVLAVMAPVFAREDLFINRVATELKVPKFRNDYDKEQRTINPAYLNLDYNIRSAYETVIYQKAGNTILDAFGENRETAIQKIVMRMFPSVDRGSAKCFAADVRAQLRTGEININDIFTGLLEFQKWGKTSCGFLTYLSKSILELKSYGKNNRETSLDTIARSTFITDVLTTPIPDFVKRGEKFKVIGEKQERVKIGANRYGRDKYKDATVRFFRLRAGLPMLIAKALPEHMAAASDWQKLTDIDESQIKTRSEKANSLIAATSREAA